MGACVAKSTIVGPEHRRASAIDRDLLQSAVKEKETLKILLLGTGSSGKSTLLKQFKILHTSQGLGDPLKYKSLISINVISSLVRTLEFVETRDNLQSLLEPTTKAFIATFKENRDCDMWTQVLHNGEGKQMAEVCEALWNDKVIRDAQKDPFSSVETPLEYFMKRIKEIASSDYTPTDQDILHIRQRTSGVVCVPILFRGTKVNVLDVGGQKNERKKWISHFDNVTAIVYVVALDDFDKPMLEDASENRLQDSLKVFEFIATCPFFEKTNIILILNKKDLFLRRIRDEKADLKEYFPDYTGELGDYRAAVNFIREKFIDIFKTSKAHLKYGEMPIIESYNTVGTDTENVKNVFRSCKKILLNEVLNDLN